MAKKKRYRAVLLNGNAAPWRHSHAKAMADVMEFFEYGFRSEIETKCPEDFVKNDKGWICNNPGWYWNKCLKEPVRIEGNAASMIIDKTVIDISIDSYISRMIEADLDLDNLEYLGSK